MSNIERELRPLKKGRRGMMYESLEEEKKKKVRGLMNDSSQPWLAFEMILESSVLYNRGVATRQKVLLTSAQACQSLLFDNWDKTGGKISNGKSWNGDLNAFRGDNGMGGMGCYVRT